MNSKDTEPFYQSAADTWRKGCLGEQLSKLDMKKFVSMSRDRFYTFQLSVNHSQIAGEGGKVDRLIRSLASELAQAPGLHHQWSESEFSNTDFGSLVSAQANLSRPE